MSFHHFIQTINQSSYKLDTSGVVGMLGGDSAADALETIHLYAGRRWAGWYNYPGAVTVAKRYGQMADSRLWDSLFPGENQSPAVTFKLAGELGPEYSGLFSGTKLRTKYLGYLIAKACSTYSSKALQLVKQDGTEARKTGSSAAVTVISVPPRQHERIRRNTTMTAQSTNTNKENHELIPIRPKTNPPLALCAIAPSLVSILTCVFCLLGRDPLCASLILLGVISSGFSSFALGTAKLHIRVPVPSPSSPPGDGLMFPEDGSIIVLKGEEADVNIITKGVFELDYSAGILPHRKHHTVGVSSLLLMTQFLAQLLLIPRCTLFGQILYLISFVASGAYHLYVVSHEREKVHRELLFRELSVRMEKRILGTRTQMAIFVCLILGNGHRDPSKSNPDAVLGRIIPNNTPVWGYWRSKVLRELERFWRCDPESSSLYVPSIQTGPEGEAEKDTYSRFTDDDIILLENLVDDAWCVFNKYPGWRDGESELWRKAGNHNYHTEEKAHLLQGCSPA